MRERQPIGSTHPWQEGFRHDCALQPSQEYTLRQQRGVYVGQEDQGIREVNMSRFDINNNLSTEYNIQRVHVFIEWDGLTVVVLLFGQ